MIETVSQAEHFLTTFSNGHRQGAADAAAEHGGAGAGFRPHELLEAALATCLNMTAQMYAEAHGIRLEQVRTRVAVDRSIPGDTVFRTQVEIDGTTPEDRVKILRAVRACPVRKTLSQNLRFEEDGGA